MGTNHFVPIQSELGKVKEVIVVGGGLVGPLAALACPKFVQVAIYERARRDEPVEARSINLTLGRRGLKALQKIVSEECYEAILDLGQPVAGREVHEAGKQPVFQRYGLNDNERLLSVSRAELHCLLIKEAERHENITIYWEHILCPKCSWRDAEGNTKLVFLRAGENDKIICPSGPILACDGSRSVMRHLMTKAKLATVVEKDEAHSYIELQLPSEAHAPSKDCLHIFPAGDHWVVLLPNKDGPPTGNLYMEHAAFEHFSESPEGKQRCREFCETHYRQLFEWIGRDEMVGQIVTKRRGKLSSVTMKRWAFAGQAPLLFLGDACHGMPPHLGQGVNCGFEDVDCLFTQMKASATVEDLFEAVEEQRRPCADALLRMTKENQRVLSNDAKLPDFQAKKRIEKELERLFRPKFRSQYALIAFGWGHLTYAVAEELGQKQEEVLDKLWKKLGEDFTEEKLKVAAEPLIRELLPQQEGLLGDVALHDIFESFEPQMDAAASKGGA